MLNVNITQKIKKYLIYAWFVIFFFVNISVQSLEAVIPVCLINPITLDYFKSPGIKI